MTSQAIDRIQITGMEAVLAQGMAAVVEVTNKDATIAALVPPKLVLSQIELRNLATGGMDMQLSFQRGQLPLGKAEFMALAALEPRALLRQFDSDEVSLLTIVYQGAAVPYLLIPPWARPLPEPRIVMGKGKNGHKITFALRSK